MMRGVDTCDETKLLAAARRGSLDAFNRLVIEHQDAAWNLAFHLLWNETAAAQVVEQAVQEMYHGLWLVRRGSFRLDFFCKVLRACQCRLKDEPKNLAPDTLRPAEGSASARLNVLPLPERIVLVLSEVEGLCPSEIAQVTRSPLPVVRQRLGSALAACMAV